MSLLILEDVKKHFGAHEVLRGTSLRIDPGEKVGLVGRNGGGKTTILRLIEGLEQPDWGTVTLRKGATLGHVSQRPEFQPGVSVRQYVELGLEETRKALARLEQISHEMSEAKDAALERLVREHDELSHHVEVLGGWETERRVEAVLRGIGLSVELWEREARTLSGGEKSRVALSRELVAGGEILLLDEPTNHLDLPGIEWIEGWIHSIKSAVLVVSHDRRLLENAVDTIYELERGELVRYSGNYSHYVRLKQERFISEQRAWEEQQDFVRKEREFIRKHMGSQRTAEAKGREKRLANLVAVPRPFNDVRKPVIRAPKAERGGETVLETRGLCAWYDEKKKLLVDVDLRIARGERIGIVGRNGTGKTTLLKIIAGRRPAQGGTIEYGHKASCGYYDQDTSELRNDSTPLLEIRRSWPQMLDQQIRDHLARYLFRGNDVDATVESLSGGERARLCLARLTLAQPSWLAMDEPTNHLDLAARTALEEMLSEFDGALVCISHDREFLDGLCNRILEVDGEHVTSYTGNYSAWRAAKGIERAEREAEKTRKQSTPAAKAAAQAAKSAAQQQRVAAAEADGSKKPSSGKVRNPWAFEKLEKKIMELEAERKTLNDSMVTEDFYRNATRMRDAQYRLAEIERDLADANKQWEEWIS